MRRIFLAVLVICALLGSSRAYYRVISTTCVRENSLGQEEWLTCPYEANTLAYSVAELKDNLHHDNEDQKFCCGDKQHRFCCSLEAKLKELPGFDPDKAENNDPLMVYHYAHAYKTSWLMYLLIFAATVIFLGLIFYIFGCVIVSFMECIYVVLCGCCGKKKKKSGKEYRPKDRSGGERSTLVVVTPPASTMQPTEQPPNYQAIVAENGYGGTPDLYQNVTPRNIPPSYEETQQQSLAREGQKLTLPV